MSKDKNGQAPKVQKAKLFEKHVIDKMVDEAARKSLGTLLDVLLPLYAGTTMTRQPGSMRIAPDGGTWRVTIECPTEGLQTQVNVDSLANLLVDVEKLLASGVVRWGLSWSKRKKNLPTIDDLIQ